MLVLNRGAYWLVGSLDGLKLLVVEDRDDERELYATGLETLGAQVTASSSVKDAQRLLEVSAPDLVVTDVALIGETGYDLLRHIRNGQLKNTPVIAITGIFQDGLPEMPDVAFDAILEKPIDFGKLDETIAKLAKSSQNK